MPPFQSAPLNKEKCFTRFIISAVTRSNFVCPCAFLEDSPHNQSEALYPCSICPQPPARSLGTWSCWFRNQQTLVRAGAALLPGVGGLVDQDSDARTGGCGARDSDRFSQVSRFRIVLSFFTRYPSVKSPVGPHAKAARSRFRIETAAQNCNTTTFMAGPVLLTRS